MLPLRDVIPPRTVPGVTVALIGATTAAAAGQYLSGGFPGVEQPAPSTFPWLHGPAALVLQSGWLTYVANLLVLWLFGENVEDRLGHLRYAILYAGSGIAGSWILAWSGTGEVWPGLGAAAAAGGIAGAYFTLFPRSRILVLFWPGHIGEAPAVAFLGVWFLLQLMGGQLSWALPAGLVGGAVLGWLLARAERSRIQWYEGGAG
jgi:rhomboid family protein